MIDLRSIKSKVMVATISILAMLPFIPIAHLFFTVVANGIYAISQNFPGFFYMERSIPGSGVIGGVGPYIVGTAILVSIATLIGVPLSILIAIYASEFIQSRLTNAGDVIITTLFEFPTIIIGLMTFALISVLNDAIRIYLLIDVELPKFSVLSGSIALTIVMLPFLYVQIKESLRSIPISIREAAYSLGLSRIKANFYIFLVYARGSIVTSILIAISKIMGETAPLLFTAFGSDFYTISDPGFLFKPIGSLTLAIYNLGLSPYEEWIATAWGAAFILLLMVLSLYIIARYIARGAYLR